jgi:hypothetical protein
MGQQRKSGSKDGQFGYFALTPDERVSLVEQRMKQIEQLHFELMMGLAELLADDPIVPDNGRENYEQSIADQEKQIAQAEARLSRLAAIRASHLTEISASQQ